MSGQAFLPGWNDVLTFPLIQALAGRRARRFARGASIPEGALAFTSDKTPLPLTELERDLVMSAVGGITGWHYLIPYNPRYAPHLPNYACSAVGRTFPSAAGFHTSEVFFTDDEGVYIMEARDAHDVPPPDPFSQEGVEAFLSVFRGRVRKLRDGRLNLPAKEPYVESHNLWIANRPGTFLAIPVADVAQLELAAIGYYLQNGTAFYDDLNRRQIPGLERFKGMYDPDTLLPLSALEQLALTECTVETSVACYAGMLMLQAMGLGGWMFDGINPMAVLGAYADSGVEGLGFRFDKKEAWPMPNPTGLQGVFEGYCPPHFRDMRAAVEALVKRKFGGGGPFNAGTPGPYADNRKVRGSARVYDERFKECVSLQAQYIYDTFGKFPGTVPSILVLMYLQAHHLDLDFYDTHFGPNAYLETHADHMERWHPATAKQG